MSKAPKPKTKPRAARAVYVTIRGKRIKTTARGKRIFRAVQVLKGLSPD